MEWSYKTLKLRVKLIFEKYLYLKALFFQYANTNTNRNTSSKIMSNTNTNASKKSI
jgi:hypothetical protein